MTGERPRCLMVHPGSELYGSDRVVRETAAAASAAGWDTLAILPSDGALVDALRRAGAVVRIAPQLVLRKSLLDPARLAALPFLGFSALARAVWLLLRARPDVVYVNTVALPVWPIAAWLTRTPLVVHIHEAEAAASRAVKRVLYGPAALATTPIVNSAYTRSVVGEVYPSLAARAEVVYNGVPGPATASTARETLDPRPRITYLGRLSHRKGTDLVLDTVAILRDRGVDVEAHIVGDVFSGYEWFEEDLRQRTDELGIGDRVRRTGFVSDVWQVLAETDVLIVPSRLDESFGNTAVEGALAGRPLIVSDTSGLREAAAGLRAAHLVAPDDAYAIADAVSSVVENWSTERALAAEDAATTAVKFAPSRYGAEIVEVIRAAAGPRLSRRHRGTI